MGLMDKLTGGRDASSGNGGEPELREGIPLGENREGPILTITDLAKERIAAVLSAQEPAIRTLRVTSPVRGKYSMNLEPEGKPGQDDTLLPYGTFEVYVDPQSLPNLEGAMLNWIDTYGGGGFQFTAPTGNDRPRPKAAPEGSEGEVWRQIQEILDEEVNPAVASHGGQINLIDVQGSTVYVEMSGGCQGCGMAQVTLKSGVERMLKDRLPFIEEILDVTDHAGGNNPYYAASTK
jgi:Fe/S biogenesis protein NfuA